MFYPPGVPDEAKTDSSLIDEAVTFINDRIANSVLKSSLEIGNYILERFFDNDIALASSKNRYKSASFYNLCNNANLSVSYITLNRMVRVAAQERFLVSGGIQTDRLKYTHRIRLLRLDNGEEKLGLARECINGSLSTRGLDQRITELKKQALEKDAGQPVRQAVDYINRASRWIKGAEAPASLTDPGTISGLDGKTKADLYRKGTDILERMSAIMAAFNDLMEMLANDMEEDEEH